LRAALIIAMAAAVGGTAFWLTRSRWSCLTVIVALAAAGFCRPAPVVGPHPMPSAMPPPGSGRV
jgi:hypothetical protein